MPTLTTIERRYSRLPATVRAKSGDKSKRMIEGHAAVFNELTTLYEGRLLTVREVIRPGAFDLAIREGQDVRLLLNHDANHVKARTKSGTLELSEDERGLFVRASVEDDEYNRGLYLSAMERGDLDQMSFAFVVRPGGESVEEEEDSDSSRRVIATREITSVDLFDVSIVTYPAYEGTDASARSFGSGMSDFAAWEESIGWRLEENRFARVERERIRNRTYVALRTATRPTQGD